MSGGEPINSLRARKANEIQALQEGSKKLRATVSQLQGTIGEANEESDRLRTTITEFAGVVSHLQRQVQGLKPLVPQAFQNPTLQPNGFGLLDFRNWSQTFKGNRGTEIELNENPKAILEAGKAGTYETTPEEVDHLTRVKLAERKQFNVPFIRDGKISLQWLIAYETGAFGYDDPVLKTW
ncbi:hypothetical protein N7495_003167 [Penicillium taxi]|uniref:uncharacterized protein n=1 Tax=Penicillium taxi TaxID=168475 RepID=UPI002545163B|nr:uncharacterized protein N7495_003167 [Penicillium taxi]KAJ5902639.1 hypothetical protein N7495_003167 [Penicillium taxi]